MRSATMKCRPSIFSLAVTAGAFAIAFLAARWVEFRQRPESGHTGAITAGTDLSARGGMPEKETKAAEIASEVFDETLLKALAMPDLGEAIRLIMAAGGIDFCADSRLIRLVELLPAARMGELAAALDANVSNSYVLKHMLGAWAQRDGAAALAWMERHPSLLSGVRESFVRGWMRAAPKAALAWVDARPGGTLTAGLREAAVEAMAEKDPDAALTLMQSRGWITQYPVSALKLMHNWGGADPQSALAGLRRLMAETGMTAATEFPNNKSAPESPYSRTWRILLRAVLQGAYDRNPADAATLLTQFTPEEYASGSAVFAREVLARDPDAAAVLFTGNPDERTRPLLLQITTQNPSLALSQLHNLSDPSLRETIVSKIEANPSDESSIKVSPEAQSAVSSVLEGMKNDTQRFSITAELCRGNSSTSPQWATALWHDLPESSRPESCKEFFRGLTAGDPDLALTEYRQCSPEIQQSALRTLAHGLAVSRPEEMLELVLRNTGEEQAVSAATLFSFWAQSDQTAALTALESHAAELNLKAVADELKNAGLLPVPHGFEPREVSTAPVAAKINFLLGNSPPPAR